MGWLAEAFRSLFSFAVPPKPDIYKPVQTTPTWVVPAEMTSPAAPSPPPEPAPPVSAPRQPVPGEYGAVVPTSLSHPSDILPTTVPVSTVAETVDLAIPAKVPADTSKDRWLGDVPYAAIDLSELFEARRLKPYLDSRKKWTIGIGSTLDINGKPVTADTPAITDRQAEVMSMRDLEKAAGLVKKAVTVPLTNRQAAVLILLANNVGDLRVAGPSLVKLANAGKWRDAANFLKEFRNERIDGVLTPSKGLRRRRWAEAAYSLGMNGLEAHRKAWAEINTPDDWPTLPG